MRLCSDVCLVLPGCLAVLSALPFALCLCPCTGPGPKQALVLRTPAADGSSIRRGSASGVLDSLVGSVVYDAMGPSPIHSSVQDDASVASSAAGALVQQVRVPHDSRCLPLA